MVECTCACDTALKWARVGVVLVRPRLVPDRKGQAQPYPGFAGSSTPMRAEEDVWNLGGEHPIRQLAIHLDQGRVTMEANFKKLPDGRVQESRLE